jgi:hypothetical protein
MSVLHRVAKQIEDLERNRAGVVPVHAGEIVSLITKALNEQ